VATHNTNATILTVGVVAIGGYAAFVLLNKKRPAGYGASGYAPVGSASSQSPPYYGYQQQSSSGLANLLSSLLKSLAGGGSKGPNLSNPSAPGSGSKSSGFVNDPGGPYNSPDAIDLSGLGDLSQYSASGYDSAALDNIQIPDMSAEQFTDFTATPIDLSGGGNIQDPGGGSGTYGGIVDPGTDPGAGYFDTGGGGGGGNAPPLDAPPIDSGGDPYGGDGGGDYGGDGS
jgi:hypothetical protein